MVWPLKQLAKVGGRLWREAEEHRRYSGIESLVINCRTFGPKLSRALLTQPCESAILRLG